MPPTRTVHRCAEVWRTLKHVCTLLLTLPAECIAWLSLLVTGPTLVAGLQLLRQVRRRHTHLRGGVAMLAPQVTLARPVGPRWD
jgi:hypothetical protein